MNVSVKPRVDQAVEEIALELGVRAMKPKQRDAIFTYVSGTDALVVLPTGYEKSLIYAILPLVYEVSLFRQPFVILLYGC